MAAFFNHLLLPLLSLAIMLLQPAAQYPLGAAGHPNATLPSPGPSYKTYILLLKLPTDAIASSEEEEEEHRWWRDSLSSPLAGSDEPRLVHTYTEVFTGYAARLTDAELDVVSNKPGFLGAFPDQMWHPMTTHTPEFLGLNKGTGVWRDTSYGKGVIIGVLDTGIYSSHPSFDDSGIPPPPSKWKGSCHSVARCNDKLIGAKFVNGNDSEDDTGHGTHTSSTAAGNFVHGASVHGLGRGTAAGIAPGAHLAMYRVCTLRGCAAADIIAGIDEAIKDGVDVLSLSLGPDYDANFSADPVAIGALSAVTKGIIVVAAAGNNGPKRFLANSAPWLLTGAAGSVDRRFEAVLQLGSGNHIHGEAFNQIPNLSSKSFPLYSDKHCKSLPGRNVAGKIVLCHKTGSMNKGSINKSEISGIMSAGAAGVVLINRNLFGFTTVLEDYGPNVVQLTVEDGSNITEYVRTTSRANASFI